MREVINLAEDFQERHRHVSVIEKRSTGLLSV
jgi:hypothetical protein